MDAQTWQIISIVGYSLAGILFFTAIIMFIKLDVWGIIGDLTGRTAAKQIQAIRERNTLEGSKYHKPSAFNLERGKLTEPVGSRKLSRKGKKDRGITKGLRKLSKKTQTQEALTMTSVTESLPTVALHEKRIGVGRELMDSFSSKTTVLVDKGNSHSDETIAWMNEVAAGAEATTVLNHGSNTSEETELLEQGTELLGYQGTEVLSQNEETTVLYPTEELENAEDPRQQAVEFTIVKDIKITHTDKVI